MLPELKFGDVPTFSPRRSRRVTVGTRGGWIRKCAAELLGTALLVFFGVGVATLMFGFGLDGGSVAAGAHLLIYPKSASSSSAG